MAMYVHRCPDLSLSLSISLSNCLHVHISVPISGSHTRGSTVNAICTSILHLVGSGEVIISYYSLRMGSKQQAVVRPGVKGRLHCFGIIKALGAPQVKQPSSGQSSNLSSLMMPS